MAAGPKDKQRVELHPVEGGRVLTPLTREEIYVEEETLWLKAQEDVLAKVWENDEDAAYAD